MENAFYKALPFIQAMAELKPVKHEVFGCDFHDVFQLQKKIVPRSNVHTRTLGANVNFRYAPVRSAEEAEQYVLNFVNDLKVDGLKCALRTILRQVVSMKLSYLLVQLKSWTSL